MKIKFHSVTVNLFIYDRVSTKRISRVLETTADAPTNVGENVTSNGSCDKQNISLMTGTCDVVHYDVT